MSKTDLLQSYIKRAVKNCIQRDEEGNVESLNSKLLSVYIGEIREIVSIALDTVNNIGDDGVGRSRIDEDKFRDSFTFKVTNVLAYEILDQFAGVDLE